MTTGIDLLAQGQTITLIDGSSVQLRYTFRALALLEARYGSINAVQKAIDTTGGGAAFTPVLQIVGAGCVGAGGFEPMIRERQTADGTRVVTDITYRRKTDGVDLAELLHPGRIGEYSDAFSAALGQALSSPGNDETTAQTVETASPGESATTSPSEPSTSSPTPSGA